MIDTFPAIMEFYYKTATKNDYFFCGPSGAGYIYPNEEPFPDNFFKKTGKYLKKVDQWYIECWLRFHEPTYQRYAELSKAKGFIMPSGPRGIALVNKNVPVILRGGTLNYYDNKKTAKDLMESIKQATKDLPKPSFTTIYVVPDNKNPKAQGGYSPEDIYWIADTLGDKEYKTITLGQMGKLIEKARKSGKLLPHLVPKDKYKK